MTTPYAYMAWSLAGATVPHSVTASADSCSPERVYCTEYSRARRPVQPVKHYARAPGTAFRSHYNTPLMLVRDGIGDTVVG
jgi:hypothetical protein